jgi:hypothetical protein
MDIAKILLYAVIVYVGVFYLLPALSDALSGMGGGLGGGTKPTGGAGEGGQTTYNITETNTTSNTTYNSFVETGGGYPNYSGTTFTTDPLLNTKNMLTSKNNPNLSPSQMNIKPVISDALKQATLTGKKIGTSSGGSTGSNLSGGVGTPSAGGGKNGILTGSTIDTSKQTIGTTVSKGTGGGGAGAR